MCGLPPGLTYDELVQVEFNLDRIRWLRVDDAVQALRIAAGQPAPEAYYKAVAGDHAAEAMGADILSRMMRRR